MLCAYIGYLANISSDDADAVWRMGMNHDVGCLADRLSATSNSRVRTMRYFQMKTGAHFSVKSDKIKHA